MKLIFLRHGQAEHNLPGWRGDTTPAKLTPVGRQAVNKSAEELAQFRFTAIYASPFRRTQETAAIIARAQAQKIKIQTDARLADIEVGHHLSRHWRRWQRLWRLRLRLMPKHEQRQFAHQKLAGGRQLAETARPAEEFLGMLRRRHRRGPVLVVGHLHTFWMLSHHLQDEPLTATLQADHFIPPADWRELEISAS